VSVFHKYSLGGDTTAQSYTLGFATYFYGLFSVYPFSMLAIAVRSSPGGGRWHVNIVVKVGGSWRARTASLWWGSGIEANTEVQGLSLLLIIISLIQSISRFTGSFPRYHLFPKIKRSHVTVTTLTQGTVCNPNAKTSWRTNVQNLKSLALAILEIF